MWLVPVTFVLALVIVIGAYWALVLREEEQSRRQVSRRLRQTETSEEVRVDLVRDPKRLSTIPAIERAFERAGLASSPLQAMLDGADVNLTMARFLLMSALAGAGTYVVVSLLTNQLGIALVLGIVAALVPYLVINRKRKVRLRRFEEQFPEAIDLIARAMRAGHGLSAGLGMVADEIDAPVGREFRLLYDWQNYGMSLPEALQRFGQRLPLMDARFFVTAVLTQRESGGNLGEVLDNLSRVIRERFRVKRQIRVLSAHGRMTAAVLAGLPPSLAAFFLVTSPEYMAELTSDPLGVRMVIGAIVLQIVGMLIIRKLVNIEY
jgi:tight adherence protein B